MKNRWWLLCAALLIGQTLLVVPEVQAAGPSAKELGAKASANFRLGKFTEALALYEQAYEAKPQPSLLFNIAQCHVQLGNLDKALVTYRNYLVSAPNAPNRADVEATIVEVEGKLAAQRSAQAPAGTPAAPATAPPAPVPTAPATPVAAPAAVIEVSGDRYHRRRGFYASLGLGGGLAAFPDVGGTEGAGAIGIRMGGYLGQRFALLGDLELFPYSAGVFGLIGPAGQVFIGERVWLRFGGGFAFGTVSTFGFGTTVIGGGGSIGLGVEIFKFPQHTLGWALGLETTVSPIYLDGSTLVLWGIGLNVSLY